MGCTQSQAGGGGAKPKQARATLEEMFVAEHNKYRKQHGAPPLEYNLKTAQHASTQAQVCLNAGALKHGSCSEFMEGQNLFCTMWTGDAAGSDEDFIKQAVKSWYDEVAVYKKSGGGVAGYQAGAGHFTQLVWKKTTHIGLGLAKKDGMAVVCANYKPAGNLFIDEEFRSNVQA